MINIAVVGPTEAYQKFIYGDIISHLGTNFIHINRLDMCQGVDWDGAIFLYGSGRMKGIIEIRNVLDYRIKTKQNG